MVIRVASRQEMADMASRLRADAGRLCDEQVLSRPPYHYYWKNVPHRCCGYLTELRGRVHGGADAYGISVYTHSLH
jgi:hypothetical protein